MTYLWRRLKSILVFSWLRTFPPRVWRLVPEDDRVVKVLHDRLDAASERLDVVLVRLNKVTNAHEKTQPRLRVVKGR